MKNKIIDLRNHMFATIEALNDPESGMDIAKAKIIAELGQVIVNSAKVEADFLKTISKSGNIPVGSGFLPSLPEGDKPQ